MSVWIFQAVPKEYDLKTELREGRGDWWRVTRLWKEMKRGDKVIFWQAGGESGIYGVGELTSDPYPGEPKFRVDLKYTNRFIPPILKKRLLKHPILKNLSILKPPFQGTNFRASGEQWQALGLIDVADFVQPGEIDVPLQYFEGATRSITVNAYERNQQARQRCLEHHGHCCCVCGFNFEKVYGELGRNFIHVHHLKPLSEIGKQYKIDPIKDLCPICPNCHAMIHNKAMMMRIEELRNQIQCHAKYELK
jgi:hypothetical protein